MSDVTSLSAVEAAERVRTGDLAPDELFAAYRDRAAAEELNAFTWVADGPDRTDVAGSPLGGVPIAVKDLCNTTFAPTAAGTTLFRNWTPERNATVVDRLEQAGAVMLGKLKMTEGAYYCCVTSEPNQLISLDNPGQGSWPEKAVKSKA